MGAGQEAIASVVKERGILQLKKLVVFCVTYFAFVTGVGQWLWLLLSKMSLSQSVFKFLDMASFMIMLGAGFLIAQGTVLRMFRAQIRQRLAVHLQDLEGIVVRENEDEKKCEVE